jgi:hypothetical protein
MKEVLWIQKYRQQIFALEILLAIVFGPALANILEGGFWMSTGFVLGVFIILEITLSITRVVLGKAAIEKTRRTKEKVEAAHTQIKKDYQELSGESLTRRPTPSTRKKKKRTKNKKTHRR